MLKMKYKELVNLAKSLDEIADIVAVDAGSHYRIIYKGHYAEAPKEGDDLFIENDLPKMNKPVKNQAFSDKTLKNGKSLFKRIHGVSYLCQSGLNTIEFINPYAIAKMEAIQILNAPPECTANLKVLDSEEGLITGIPNYQLNQFAFNVNVRELFHEQRSQYEADVFLSLKVVLEITLPSSFEGFRLIGFNIELNEIR